jgi:hypothetical protein
VLECCVVSVSRISMSSGGGGRSETVAGLAGLAGFCDRVAKEAVDMTVVGAWFDCGRVSPLLLSKKASKRLISSSNGYLRRRARCQDSKVLVFRVFDGHGMVNPSK